MEQEMRDRIQALLDRLFQEKAPWPIPIKEIRALSQVDISTAQKIALSHDKWRRLISYRINHELDCRKEAKTHMLISGRKSLIISVGEELVVSEAKLS